MEGEPAQPADDLSFAAAEGRFSLRVRGLFLHEGRMLAVREDVYPRWHLPGGRVRLHESAEDALLRETRAPVAESGVPRRGRWFAFRRMRTDALPHLPDTLQLTTHHS